MSLRIWSKTCLSRPCAALLNLHGIQHRMFSRSIKSCGGRRAPMWSPGVMHKGILYPYKLEIKVRWGDMDAYGHVNNAMYFKYFETARTESFADIPIKDDNDMIILAETFARFRLPLEYPDTVIVGARVEIVDNNRGEFMQHYAIESGKTGEIHCEGSARIVTISSLPGGGRVPIPDRFKEVLAAMDSDSFS
eukprot:m.53749 g.53749  ORF g.53749 m.53749 type:complete len:192 (+) comp10882_c0_seq1:194-769(+)